MQFVTATVNPAWHQLNKLGPHVAHRLYAGQPQAIEKLLQSAAQEVHQMLCQQTTRQQADRFMAHFNCNDRSYAVDMRYLQQQRASWPTHHDPMSVLPDRKNVTPPPIPLHPLSHRLD